MLARGTRAGIAVSGGADSVFLLHVLRQLAVEQEWHLEVLHVNHHLRAEESDADQRFVETLAAELELLCHVEHLHLAASNLEESARKARHAFFARIRDQRHLAVVATGHTQSDQAETLLFRLLRGTGPGGLAGILPVTKEGLVRPLLGLTHAEIEHWLEENHLPWREDSSNQDLRFTRNRIRGHILPMLEKENPRLVRALTQYGEIGAAEEAYWQEWTGRFLADHGVARHGTWVIPVRVLSGLSTAERRRAIRGLVQKVKGDLSGIEFDHTETVGALVSSPDGDGRAILPGVDVMRSLDWVRFAPAASFAEGRFWEIPVAGPGTYRLRPGLPSLRLSLLAPPSMSAKPLYNKGSSHIDWDRIDGALVARSWRPGDRYHPVGHTEEVKLKSLFQQFRVPLWERKDWPLLCLPDRIVWSRQFGVAEDFLPSAGTRQIVEVGEVD